MIKLKFNNCMIALTLVLVVTSCGDKSNNTQQSKDAENSLNNLDFEIEKNGLPSYWYAGKGGNQDGNFKVSLDNLEKQSGKKSLKMEKIGVQTDGSIGLLTGTLPVELVSGKTVEFKGWIKTKDIENGYARLWFRVDGENDIVLAFENMSEKGLNGTNNWTQVSLKIDVSKEVKNINFGSMLQGDGIAWFDNFELFIDGVKHK